MKQTKAKKKKKKKKQCCCCVVYCVFPFNLNTFNWKQFTAKQTSQPSRPTDSLTPCQTKDR